MEGEAPGGWLYRQGKGAGGMGGGDGALAREEDSDVDRILKKKETASNR